MSCQARKWRRDENRALVELAQGAVNRLSVSWARIAADLEARFPGRRVYSARCCRRRYNILQTENGGSGHYWTQQEKQTLAVLCQDHDEGDIDWDDVAEQMRMIFDRPREFAPDDVRKRYWLLRRSSGVAAAVDEPKSETRTAEPSSTKPPEAAVDRNGAKRRRSGTSPDAIRPAIVLGCEDDEFVPAYAKESLSSTVSKKNSNASKRSVYSPCSRKSVMKDNEPPSQIVLCGSNTEPPTKVDENLRIVHEFVKQHMQALQKLQKLTDSSPDSLNDLVRAIATDPLSDDDCDVLMQWSITCDASNIGKWMEYAERCDLNDRLRWPIIVPQRTLYMFQLISSGRLAIVPDRVQSEMNRLHVRLRDQYLRRHSPLYCLVAGHRD